MDIIYVVILFASNSCHGGLAITGTELLNHMDGVVRGRDSKSDNPKCYSWIDVYVTARVAL